MLNYPVAYTTFVTDGTRKFDFWSARRTPIDDSVNRGAMARKQRTSQPMAKLDFVGSVGLAEVFARFELP
jgi:hypothetical protein